VMRFGIDQQNINTSRVDHPSPHSWRLVCLSFQLFRLAITSFIIVFHPEDLIHILILLWLNMEYITRLSLESICHVNCILSRHSSNLYVHWSSVFWSIMLSELVLSTLLSSRECLGQILNESNGQKVE